MMLWDHSDPGVMALPSGRLVRGRGLRDGKPAGPAPAFGIYLLGRPPAPVPWDHLWIRWRDFGLPSGDLRAALLEAWERSSTERVELACAGGKGRTGTALACLAVIDGVPANEAVAYVRRHYNAHAVETPWQRRYVERFTRE